jgi:hypothetical protein
MVPVRLLSWSYESVDIRDETEMPADETNAINSVSSNVSNAFARQICNYPIRMSVTRDQANALGSRFVRDARQSFERLSVHSVVLAKRSSDVLASILMLLLHTSLRRLREAADYECVVIGLLKYAYGLTDGHGWPIKSSQSVPCSGCRATPCFLMSPRIWCI